MKRSTRWFLVLLALAIVTCASIVAISSLSGQRSPSHGHAVLHVDLEGPWPERDGNASLNDLLGVHVATLRDLIGSIEAAANDDEISGLELRVGRLDVGWAKAQEIREAIQRFKASHKPVVAFMEEGDDGSYYLACGADQVWLLESGTLWLDGISADVSFYRGTLDKVGVQPDILQIAEYKSAADAMMRKTMSDAHREEMDSLLGGLYSELVAGIAESLHRTPDEIAPLVSNGPYTPRAALDAGLVTHLGFEDEAAAALDDAMGGSHPRISLRHYARQLEHPRGRKTIAIIDCHGTIVGGSSSEQLFGGSSMGSETIAQAIRDARDIPGIAAIVLRVDSPGGSSVASDVIWRETMRTKEQGIPVVVSMSDVAASGGYWISMSADKVVAEPATITGSIGIFGGKYVTHDLMEDHIGVHTETVSKGAHAAFFSSNAPFTDEERKWLDGQLHSVYGLFLERTAKGRGFATTAEVDSIARGRVWTGRQAHERKLVDELGGLDRALDVAAGLAKIPDDERATLRWLPESPRFLDMFLDKGPAAMLSACVSLEVAKQATAAVPAAVRALATDPGLLGCLDREGVVAYMPVRVLAR